MGWKDAIFEQDPKKPAKVERAEPLPPPPPVPPLGGRIKVIESPVYQTLKAKVDFDQTDAGAALAKYLNPLREANLEEHAMYRAAVAQAKAQEGLSVAKILATFDGLKTRLQDEAAAFEQSAKDVEAESADKVAKRNSLQAQLDALNIEIQSAAVKIGSARVDFQQAVKTLTQELDSQKLKYSELLKG